MYAFEVSAGAEADFATLGGRDRRAAGRIAVYLQELDGDPYRVDETATPGYSDDAIEKVAPVAVLQQRGLNCQLVRYRDVAQWRLIFGVNHHPRRARLVLLAIMPRAADYADGALWDRVEREYADAGLDPLA